MGNFATFALKPETAQSFSWGKPSLVATFSPNSVGSVKTITTFGKFRRRAHGQLVRGWANSPRGAVQLGEFRGLSGKKRENLAF